MNEFAEYESPFDKPGKQTVRGGGAFVCVVIAIFILGLCLITPIGLALLWTLLIVLGLMKAGAIVTLPILSNVPALVIWSVIAVWKYARRRYLAGQPGSADRVG